MDNAFLSNDSQYTIFKYGNTVIKFKSPYSLEYYSKINEWDDGYIVVMTKYKHSEKLIEEYIDLVPILENLYIDKNEFLRPIKEVVIQHD
jgi:hypothetical protein